MSDIKVLFKPTFLRKVKKCNILLQEEIQEKIELFKNRTNHKQLKVHKLTGRLLSKYSFSVNYKIRIVFIYISKDKVVLLSLGDHDVYDI